MRYASALHADTVTLDAGDVHMEGDSVLDTSSRGLTTGPGAGGVTSVGTGIGAGYGGYGGGVENVSYASGEGCVLP